MFDKQFLGIVSVVLAFVGYAPYFWSILKGRTHPHAFSWIVWTVANGVVFFAQLSKGAGAGAWVTGVISGLCLTVVLLAIKRGEKHITRSDWVSFIGALATIPLWYFTKDPLGAVILATTVDALGCYPTLRKSYAKPYEEELSTWGLAALRSVISIFALENYSLVTAFNPVALVVTNGTILFMLLWRRMILPRPTK